MKNTHAGHVDITDIVGNIEAAERLGVTRSAMVQWRKRHSSFPAPVLELRSGPLYRWSEVATWYDSRNP